LKIQPLPKTEIYQEIQKSRPKKSPGPSSYWKSPKLKYVGAGQKSKATEIDPQPELDTEGNEIKQYLMKRDKADKKVYKPMKSYFF
jgi:hypothetical protein